ncbi:hypothetical protein HZB03_04090 [Candidatus Woesearchaeota archaeon]|nr:hypothetical protein [Candidatus Woesearchaeota archaeon]
MSVKRNVMLIATLMSSVSCQPKQHLSSMTETKSLIVLDSFQHPYTFKDREAGEKDLESLAKTASKEDEWFYVEDRHTKEGVWFDVGYQQTATSTETDVQYLENLLNTVFATSTIAKHQIEVTEYHIHPYRSLMEQILRSRKPTAYRRNDGTTTYGISPHDQEDASVPSSADILAHATIKNAIKEETRLKGFFLLPAVVVTPWGKFVYDVSQDFAKRYEAEGAKFIKIAYEEAHQESESCKSMDCTLAIFGKHGMIIEYERRESPKVILMDR